MKVLTPQDVLKKKKSLNCISMSWIRISLLWEAYTPASFRIDRSLICIEAGIYLILVYATQYYSMNQPIWYYLIDIVLYL